MPQPTSPARVRIVQYCPCCQRLLMPTASPLSKRIGRWLERGRIDSLMTFLFLAWYRSWWISLPWQLLDGKPTKVVQLLYTVAPGWGVEHLDAALLVQFHAGYYLSPADDPLGIA